MSLRIGLDLGTSNSGAAVFDGRVVRPLPLEPGGSIPEVVKTILYVTRDHRASIGREAVELYFRHNVGRQRRFVPQKAGEIEYFGADMAYVREVYVYVDELQPGRLLQYLKTSLRRGTPGGYEGTRIFDRFYPIGELIRIFLAQMKSRADAVLGEPIRGVTLGRPVRFSTIPEQDRRAQQVLGQAAREAGFEQVDFELEPVAAARSFELTLSRPQNVLVFDFGGGTLDLAVLTLGDAGRRKVHACHGVDVAGSDFDRAIIRRRLLPCFGQGLIRNQPDLQELIADVPEWNALVEQATPGNRALIEKAIRAGQAPVRLKALQALIFDDLAFSFFQQVENAKIALSSQGAATVAVQGKNIYLWELYTRAQFEHDLREHANQVEQAVLETVAASGLELGQIETVVKTGGSSEIPLFTQMLQRLFGPERVRASDPFGSVAAGLAICAWRGG